LTQGFAIFGLDVWLPLQLLVNRGADQSAVFAVDGLKVILYLRGKNQGKGRRLGHDEIIDVQRRKVNVHRIHDHSIRSSPSNAVPFEFVTRILKNRPLHLNLLGFTRLMHLEDPRMIWVVPGAVAAGLIVFVALLAWQARRRNLQRWLPAYWRERGRYQLPKAD